MAEIPRGKGSDWQEREAWILNPPSMSDRADPRAPAGTFVTPPVPDITNPIPRNYSSDYATRDVEDLITAGGTPKPPAIPVQTATPSTGQTTTVTPAPAPAPNPWEGMTRHDQLNEYVDQANIKPPEEWSTWNISDKKTWLTENYAK